MSFAGNIPRPHAASGRAEAEQSAAGRGSGGSTDKGGDRAATATATRGERNIGGTGPVRRTTVGAGSTAVAWRDSGGVGEVDWGRVGAFGAGIAIGALIGAGAALLYAPQSGRATRADLRRRARYLGYSAGDAWDDIGRELRAVARRGRRKMSRGVTRGRWRAADAIDG